MPKNFFQDMVRIKKAGELRPKTASEPSYISRPPQRVEPTPEPKPVPPPPSPLPPLPPAPPKEVQATRDFSRPERETEFASVYDISNSAHGRGRTSRGLWFLAGACVLLLLFAVSILFSEAKVTIEPRVRDLALNKNFFATKGASSSNLSFDLISVPGETKKTVEGAEEREVNESAKGVVIIYNNFSGATQRLDIDTRLEGDNGKIYKTEKQVTVPGKKSDGTPGSVEVNVYASESGDAYNSSPLDFSIVGFKGTPKYSKFYARSKGEITGGKSGTTKTISKEAEAATFAELKDNLKTELLQKAHGSIPPGFILFDNATSLSIEGQKTESVPGSEGMIELSVHGTLHGFLFNEEKITEKIAETSIEQYDGSPVYVSGFENLTFTVYDQDALSFRDTRNMTFNLLGDIKVVWKLDEEKIASDMLARPKKDLNQILSSYPNVVSGNVVLNPFWRRSFPEERGDIKVIINYPD